MPYSRGADGAAHRGAITITGYAGSNGVVQIPGTIEDLPVISIGDWAFYGTGVTNVLIPDSVTSIGNGAFFDCESLTNVTLGMSVTSIGDWAFGFCPSLMSVRCRGNAPSLGGVNVFYGNLATIYYLSGATGWGPTFDGHPAVLWNPPVPYLFWTDGASGTVIITGYTGSNAVVSIPDTINFLPVSSVEDWAFEFCYSLAEVTIPNSVTNIGTAAFQNCPGLFDLTLGDHVAQIGSLAFRNCTNLTSVVIPDRVSEIGGAAFAYCTGLSNITIGTNVNLTSVTIPNSLASIGDWAFAGCSRLTHVLIGNNVANIGEGSFAYCNSLTNITIPVSVTHIGSGAFQFCGKLKKVSFHGDVPGFVGTSIFHDVLDVVVYYLPGTTGSGSTFAGRPTAPWYLPYPLILNSPSFGVRTNQFGFTISRATNISVVVEACTNLSNPDWEAMQTNTLTTGSAYFSDPQWTNYPARFYRLRSP